MTAAQTSEWRKSYEDGFWGSVELTSGRVSRGFVTETLYGGLPFVVVHIPVLMRPLGRTFAPYEATDWDSAEMFPLGYGFVMSIKLLSEEAARCILLPTEPAPPGNSALIACLSLGWVHPDEIGELHGPNLCPSCDQMSSAHQHHFVRRRASRTAAGENAVPHEASQRLNLAFWFQCLHCEAWAEPSLERGP